jgi:prepilin-type N-terminal cleavage/methylation domain-containing protein
MRGFTLIELLVVISIVGMLSSITLASVQAARDKGRIAAGLRFASYNYHVIGIDTIAHWNFENTDACNTIMTTILCVADGMGGKTVLKTFANSTPANVTASTIGVYFSSNTPTGKGKSGVIDTSHYFANTDNYISQQKMIVNSNLKPKDFTVSVWVYFTSANPEGPIVYISRLASPDGGASYDYEQVFNLYVGANQYTCYSDVFGGSSVSFGPVVKNSWQNITCSFNSTTGTIAGFVDGKKVSSITATYNSNFYSNNLPINSVGIGTSNEDQPNPPAPTNFTGFIDDVIIYGAALVE